MRKSEIVQFELNKNELCSAITSYLMNRDLINKYHNPVHVAGEITIDGNGHILIQYVFSESKISL